MRAGGLLRTLVMQRGLGLGSRVRGNDGKGGAGTDGKGVCGSGEGLGSSALVLVAARYPRQARV